MIRWPVLALLLAGCPYVGEGKYAEEIRDFDGDGAVAERFGGPDCVDDDPRVTDCDADGDGARTVAAGGDDCDDGDATVFPGAAEICGGRDEDCDGLVDDADPDLAGAPTWYPDDDGDGFGDEARPRAACLPPTGHVDQARDCDDARSDVHPGAPEYCDGDDRNCDGDPRDDAVDKVALYPDADGDGFAAVGAAPTVLACSAGPGTSTEATDCDDTDDAVFPGAVEVWYDGIDQDCDGAPDDDQDGDGFEAGRDCDDTDPERFAGAPEICNGVDDDCDGLVDDDDPSIDDPVRLRWYVDADGDGFGGADNSRSFCPAVVPAGYVPLGTDCDDRFASVRPGGIELCDDLDNDCNGAVDDSPIDPSTFYQDADGDGHGAALAPVLACDAEPGSGLATSADDCNDADPGTYPGALEICGDTVRQDCSALAAADCDGDGFEDEAAGGTDCDDTDADVFPGAREICNGFDDDCDDRVDDQDPNVDLSTIADWYRDADQDGFGDPTDLVLPAACAPVPGAAANALDCDDARADVSPEAPERCDGVDNDCDGAVDDDDDDPIAGPPEWFRDQDGDGAGDPAVRYAQTCAPPASGAWVLEGTDCRPSDPTVHPLATEICNGLDDDCDALVDQDDPQALLIRWGEDADGDGFGSPLVQVAACSPPSGHVANLLDCDDASAAVSPAAIEVCNGGLDDDCDGWVDDADPDVGSATTWYRDLDGDGFGDPGFGLSQCGEPAGYVGNDGDCDDASPAISPAATEICGGLDDDCDGLIDEDDPGLVANLPVWPDGDGDGFGSATGVAALRCGVEPGWAASPSDCDDAVATTFPGAPETCNGADDDCDGLIDTADPSLTGGQLRFRDLDGDGFGGGAATLLCAVAPGYVATGGDCDDAPGTGGVVFPGATEVCNGRDDDCDGGADDLDPQGAIGGTEWWGDLDRDGFGDPGNPLTACAPPSAAWVAPGSPDCDDTRAAVNPTAIEVCNGLDDDCDGPVDGADASLVSALSGWFDGDGDGFGAAGSIPVAVCGATATRALNDDDCNDASAAISPADAEVCNGIDDDCDGGVDDRDPQGAVVGTATFWPDLDRDGFGDPAGAVQACAAPLLYLPGVGQSDCDDGDGDRYPGAPEVCDGIDNDCDPFVDALDSNAVGLVAVWFDLDGDGFGDPASPGGNACAAVAPYVANDDDCAPTNPAVGAPGTFFQDDDGDGFGDPAAPVAACVPGPGVAATGTDCDDGDPALYPGQDLLVVPAGAYGTLQAAVDAVCAPATITLLQGATYDLGSLPLTFAGKQVGIEGTDPSDPAILRGGGAPAVQVVSLDHPGLTLANVRIEGSGTGAVVSVDGGELTLTDVELAGGANATQGGGGLRVTGASDVLCEGCRIEGSTAASGAGVYADGGASVVLVDSWIADNDATGPGSGLHAVGADLLLVDTVFSANGTSAGLELEGGGTATVFGLTVLDEPGGVRFASVDLVLDGARVERTGRMQFYAPALTPVTMELHDLVVRESTDPAAAIQAADPRLTLILRNLLVLGGSGRGIDATGVNLTVENATFARTGNAGLDLFGGSWTLRGLLFTGITGTNAILNPIAIPGPIQNSLFTTAVEASSAGTGNVAAADPQFLTAHPNLPLAQWDVHLRATSPARNAGPSGAAFQDTDGTRNDIGYTGGPGGDNAFYADSDGDGLWDGWEEAFFGTLARDGTADLDLDGLFDGDEFLEGCDPTVRDTDGDGLLDGDEVFLFGTAPLDPLDP